MNRKSWLVAYKVQHKRLQHQVSSLSLFQLQRALLSEMLDVQLRIQVLRLKPSSPLRNGDGIKSNSRNEAEREPSPLPRQRSFLRPRARGYSSGKLVEGVSPSGTPRRSDATTTDDSSETGERLSGSRLKGSVSEGVLGQRVRMLQLMGIESLVGERSDNSTEWFHLVFFPIFFSQQNSPRISATPSASRNRACFYLVLELAGIHTPERFFVTSP